MKKQTLILALMLVLTTSLSVFADGEMGTGNRVGEMGTGNIIEIIYDAFGTVVEYIYG